MSEEIDALNDAIRLNRETILENILAYLKIDEINEDDFQNLVGLIKNEDDLRFK